MTRYLFLRIAIITAYLLYLRPGVVPAQSSVFDANKLKVKWEVVENDHQGKRKCLTAFTFFNTGRTALPSGGWQLYFNFIRSVVPGSATGQVNIGHVNGDLYKLVPAAGFPGVQPGDSLRVEFLGDAWVVNFTDAPAGLYLVWDQDPDKGHAIKDYSIRPSTQPRQYLRFAGDKAGLITPAAIYARNKDLQDIPADRLPKVFPTPQGYTAGTGELELGPTVNIRGTAGLLTTQLYLSKELRTLFGKPVRGGHDEKLIELKEDSTLGPEAYTLVVNEQGVTITAADSTGAFYAVQSLKTLIPPASWAGPQKGVRIPFVQVRDAPRFAYRAFMLDVARNFQPKQQILRLLDLMALYKLNVLHFHLNDDEGWRIEIPSLPELAQVGGKRGHSAGGRRFLPPSYGSGPDTTNPAGSGYYTRKDFIEILRYATERHIRVIPEIESPGHARAAIKAMDVRFDRLTQEGRKEDAEAYLLRDLEDQSVYRSVQSWNDNVMNVALPSVYRFIDKVVSDLQATYREAGAPLASIHMGGDEVPAGVWERSPAVKALMQQHSDIKTVDDLWYYYFRKVYALLKARGLQLAGWEEAGMRKTLLDGQKHMIANPDFVNDSFVLDVWNNVMGGGAEDLSYRLANSNYKVVLSGVSNFYFDMAYMKAFDEPGFYWGGFVDVDKPFYFIPLDYYKNTKVDGMGDPVTPALFLGKDRLTTYGAGNITGIQGLLWSETIRSPERMEYMLLPKMLGLAERAWAKDPDWATEKDSVRSEELYRQAWSVFANVLGRRELPRLDHYNNGYQYRIPTAGAVIEGGMLKANVQLPGLSIRYTTDGREPTGKSKEYTAPVAVNGGPVKLRVFDTRGRGSRTVTVE